MRRKQLAASPQILIPVAALLAVFPMLIAGPSCGHDFDFHLLSWLEAARQFAQGSFPHWAYTPAFNAGEPRFIFYPPLSWSLGALLGLLLPWTLVPTTFTWIALTLSGLTFHALARRYVTPAVATLGAILYLDNPYMLFTAYERSAFAELLAAAWLPLLFAAALPLPSSNQSKIVPSSPHNLRHRILQTAIPVTLLWLTNAPAAVMSTYALAFLTLIRLLTPSSPLRLRAALATAAGTALGLAIAAFYIVPAAYQRRFVQIELAVIQGMRVSDHFLFHRMSGPTPDDRFHDAVVRAASVVALTLLAAIATAVIVLATKHRSSSSQMSFLAEWRNPQISPSAPANIGVPLILLTLVIAFLLTPISLPVWTHLPELAFLQFPWRLNAILGLIFALLTTLALPRKTHPLLALLTAALLITPAWTLFHQRCDPDDTIGARVALFRSGLGTDPTDEYTPIDANPDALHPRNPPYWLIPIPPGPTQAERSLNSPAPGNRPPGTAPAHLTLTIPTPEYLILDLRQYPAWQIHLNNTLVQPAKPERDDGLISLLLPPGTNTIDVTLIRTPDQTLGVAVSALALLIALALRLWRPDTALALLPADTLPATLP